MVNILKKR